MAAPWLKRAKARWEKAVSLRKPSSKRRIYRPYFDLLESRLNPATFKVNTTLDTIADNLVTGTDAYGNISLRSAVQAANATPGSNTIVLGSSTYQLAKNGPANSAQLVILNSLIIEGVSANSTVIDANFLDRVFDIQDSANVVLKNLTVENGSITGEGGGIFNAGTLNIVDSILTGNQAIGAAGSGSLSNPAPVGGTVNGLGGAIYNTGTLEISGTTLSNNTATGGEGGSSVSYGSGGGGGGMGAGGAIFNFGGLVVITASTFSGNTAQGGAGNLGGPGAGGPGGSGGGVGGDGGDTGSPGTSGADGGYGGGGGGGGSSLSGGRGGVGGDGGFGGGGGGGGSGPADGGGDAGLTAFGAGFGGYGGLTSGGGGGGGLGAGGAFFNESGTASFVNVTFWGNTAQGGNGGATWAFGQGDAGDGGNGMGGGLFVDTGTVSLLNTTIANNFAVAGTLGGILAVDGQTTSADPGINGQAIGGGVVNNTGILQAQNTIIATNNAVLSPDGNGTLTSLGHNLIENTTFLVNTGTLAGNIIGVDPQLAPLADNGGETQTARLFSISVAIDAGDDSAAPPTDERGISRLGVSDIGAFEYNPYVVTNTNDSGPGSLRDAIIANNNSEAGGNTITFFIGGVGSTQTIQPLPIGNGDSLDPITKPVTLDGWSQAGPNYTGAPLIIIDGSAATQLSRDPMGFDIQSDNVVVRGFDIVNFPGGDGSGYGIGISNVTGDANVWIYGNYIGTDPTGTIAQPNGSGGILIGSGVSGVLIGVNPTNPNAAVQANVIAGNGGPGIVVDGDGNSIFGNFVGVAADGVFALGMGGAGIEICGSNNVIGGTGLGNIIANNQIGIAVDGGSGDTIQGNYISSNSNQGIYLGYGVSGVLIGADPTSPKATQANVIVANGGAGIAVDGDGNGIYGNNIGVAADGVAALGNLGDGIDIFGSKNIVGGVGPGQGNIIANNQIGVAVQSGSGDTIRGNEIYSNAGLGIDLSSGEGVGNLGQAAPQLVSDEAVTDSIVVNFDLPFATYPVTIDFYKAGPEGTQGLVRLGTVTYSSDDGQPLQSIAFTPLVPLTVNDSIVATATDADGNTSEFSAPLKVSALPVLALQGPAIAYTQYSPPVVLSSQATLTDLDNRPLAGGVLTVSFDSGAAAGDQLAIQNQGNREGQIGVQGNTVFFEGQAIGTFTGGSDGVTPLMVTLNDIATLPRVQCLVRSITFSTTSFSTTPRSIGFVLTDGRGGTSNAPTTQIAVSNVAPYSLGIALDSTSIVEGGTVTLTASFTNPDKIDVPTVTINWGDGTAPQTFQLAVGAKSFSISHEFTIDESPLSPQGTKTINVSVVDGASPPATATIQVTVANFIPVVVAGPASSAEAFIAAGTTFIGQGYFIDPSADTWTVTVNYGDGSSTQPVAYDAQHNFSWCNVYTADGTYTVTVTVADHDGASGQTSFLVNVFTAQPSDPARVTAAPGTTVDSTSGNVTVQLTRSASATNDGSLVVAQLPVGSTATAGTLIFSTSNGQGALLTAAEFDVRSINLGNGDTAVVTFDVYSPNGMPPILTMIDPATGKPVAVVGSRNVPNSLSVTLVPNDPANPPDNPQDAKLAHYKVRIVFDATSTPNLINLKGTVFTLVVPQIQPDNQALFQSELILASNGSSSDAAAAQPQLEVSFSRGSVTSGSETTAATVASQASQAVFSVGADVIPSNTAFVRDMLFESYRAFGDNPDTVPPRQPPMGNGPGGGGGGGQLQARVIDGIFTAAAAGTPLVSLTGNFGSQHGFTGRIQRGGDRMLLFPQSGFSSERPSPGLLTTIGGAALALLTSVKPRLAASADFAVLMPGFAAPQRSSKRRRGFWRWLFRWMS